MFGFLVLVGLWSSCTTTQKSTKLRLLPLMLSTQLLTDWPASLAARLRRRRRARSSRGRSWRTSRCRNSPSRRDGTAERRIFHIRTRLFEQMTIGPYRKVQLDLTPEIEVSHMLFERCHAKDRNRSLNQHIKYFNFQSYIQLNHPILEREKRVFHMQRGILT